MDGNHKLNAADLTLLRRILPSRLRCRFLQTVFDSGAQNAKFAELLKW